MSVDFFSRSKMSAEEHGLSDSAAAEPVPKTPFPSSAEIPNSIHWTKEQLEAYIRIREKYDKEGLIRETAAGILANLCQREDGNLSAGACARWSVMAAVALIKYSKDAADDEEFWTDEDGKETFDYLFDTDDTD